MSKRHVTVCICTYKRPDLLLRLLDGLLGQQLAGKISFSIVVTDNDAQASARDVVTSFSSRSPIKAIYCSEPRQNIALARNKAIEHATGEFVACIDDDEFPADDWLIRMVAACDQYQASGVLGPVRPHFDQPPPAWLVTGRFCWRPEPPTGTIMSWSESRTGNLLFRRAILVEREQPFDERFGTGGEDKDFFMRMTQRGCVFVWCNEGIAYETVPPSRWTRSYYLNRALLRGQNVLKHPGGHFKMIATSMVAVPVYTALLPLTLLLGQHVFMKFCIKLCDHLGRLLAAVGIDAVRSRQM